MRPSDCLADAIADEGKRWAAMMGFDQPLPQPAKNGNLWGFVVLQLGLFVMAWAFAAGPWYIQAIALVGLMVTMGRKWTIIIGATKWKN